MINIYVFLELMNIRQISQYGASRIYWRAAMYCPLKYYGVRCVPVPPCFATRLVSLHETHFLQYVRKHVILPDLLRYSSPLPSHDERVHVHYTLPLNTGLLPQYSELTNFNFSRHIHTKDIIFGICLFLILRSSWNKNLSPFYKKYILHDFRHLVYSHIENLTVSEICVFFLDISIFRTQARGNQSVA